ncbi:MAG: hypothetical protein IJ173_02130 [Kiritimatiellae bacterium]|nr:hypothetical protein [Kiritimatiellia bacterium]
MISQYALDAIDELIKAGLQPTPADIIRLNALGLKIDHGVDDTPLYTLRRAARIGGVWLREPTIAHHLFIADCRAILPDGGRVGTAVMRAWVLSLSEPPAQPPADISAAIDSFIKNQMMDVTLDQIETAVDFCLYGYDSTSLEFPARPQKADDQPIDTADETAAEEAFSFEIGLVHRCEAIGLGISFADAIKHTRAQLHAIYNRAIEKRAELTAPELRDQFLRDRKNRWISEFDATVDEIAARLRAEKTSQGGTEERQ